MRVLCVIVLLFVNISLLQAQAGIGPEGGIGMSSMRFAPQIGFTQSRYKPVVSGRIGGVTDIRLNKRIYFQAGLFLSRKGQNREFSFYYGDSLNEEVKQTLGINYIEMPLTVIFKSGQQGKGRVFAGIGPSPAYIIGGRNKLEATGKYNDTPFARKFDTRIVAGNPLLMFDIGLNLSAGYELPTGLYFRLYYTAGMLDLGLGGEIDKNRMWGISAGYIFGKGRNINTEVDDLIDKTD